MIIIKFLCQTMRTAPAKFFTKEYIETYLLIYLLIY